MAISRRQQRRNEQVLRDLLAVEGNDRCADCNCRGPRWASYNLGIFLCVRCAALHRKLGTHISKVRSISLDAWKPEQIENMRNIGNIKSNAYWNPNPRAHPVPVILGDDDDSVMERYIRDKYEKGAFRQDNYPEKSQSNLTSSVPNEIHDSIAPSVNGNNPYASNVVKNPATGMSDSLLNLDLQPENIEKLFAKDHQEHKFPLQPFYSTNEYPVPSLESLPLSLNSPALSGPSRTSTPASTNVPVVGSNPILYAQAPFSPGISTMNNLPSSVTSSMASNNPFFQIAGTNTINQQVTTQFSGHSNGSFCNTQFDNSRPQSQPQLYAATPVMQPTNNSTIPNNPFYNHQYQPQQQMQQSYPVQMQTVQNMQPTNTGLIPQSNSYMKPRFNKQDILSLYQQPSKPAEQSSFPLSNGNEWNPFNQ